MRSGGTGWLAVALAVALAACGREAGVWNPAELADALVERVGFEEDLLQADSDLVELFYSLDSRVQEYAVYLSGGGTAEEVAVLQVAAAGDLAAAVEVLERRLEQQRGIYESYLPGEMAKLNSPVLLSRGTTAVLVVSGDPAAREIARELLG